MSVQTHHWSGSGPTRIRAYHVEIAREQPLPSDYLYDLRVLWRRTDGARSVDFAKLKSYFAIYKNDDLSTPTDYGTWDFNEDPRDGSPNIEIASLCMPKGATAFDQEEPFTIAHAWAHAYIAAVIAKLKNMDVMGSFDAAPYPQFQNGPIPIIGTHGTRAIQQVNFGVQGAGASSEALSKQYGYFFGSGDPQSRADLFCLDGSWYDANVGVTIKQALESATELRWNAHVIKAENLVTDMWGLDGPETP